MESIQPVIVGRFQTPKLHEGHKALINRAIARGVDNPPIVFIGISPARFVDRNPLPYEQRKIMLETYFSKSISIHPLPDMGFSDEAWSEFLDYHIDLSAPLGCKPVLMGGPDSFIPRYKGKYSTEQIEAAASDSATRIRDTVTKDWRRYHQESFRGGIIYAVENRFPISYTTVDIAILNEDADQILLGRKAKQNGWRFIGGFADPKSESFEEDARREVMEETCNEISHPKYLFSMKIDDWRYAREKDKIKTMFFVAKYIYGPSKGNDDIEEVRWFEISDLIDNKDIIVPNHQRLFAKMLTYPFQDL